MYKWSPSLECLLRFRDMRDILQGDILRYIKKDIFNLLIRYPKYLKISSANYKERIDNYTKYLKVKI